MGKRHVEKDPEGVDIRDIRSGYKKFIKELGDTYIVRVHGGWICNLLMIITCVLLGVYFGWNMGRIECIKAIDLIGCELPDVDFSQYSPYPLLNLSDPNVLMGVLLNETPIAINPKQHGT